MTTNHPKQSTIMIHSYDPINLPAEDNMTDLVDEKFINSIIYENKSAC